MRWPCFLLLASLPLASAATAQTTGSASSPKSLTFDVAQVPATRDSFVFRLRGQERGWAVWQYEIRPLEMTQEVVYTAASEFRPVEEERLRVVVNRLTGQPISTFHHIDLFSPGSDTDRKSTRLNSSHLVISYAVFCLKKKKHLRRSCPC